MESNCTSEKIDSFLMGAFVNSVLRGNSQPRFNQHMHVLDALTQKLQ